MDVMAFRGVRIPLAEAFKESALLFLRRVNISENARPSLVVLAESPVPNRKKLRLSLHFTEAHEPAEV